MMRLACLIILAFFSTFDLSAQTTRSYSFGEIDPDWLDMQYYEPDSSQAAAICFDMGLVSFELYNRTPIVRYEYRQVIKIFSEEALSLADISLSYDPKTEKLVEISASTYNLNAEQEPVRFKLDKKRIKEDFFAADGKRTKSFKMPFVRKGSLIEIQYVVKSKNFEYLRDWQFQRELPVLQSEYHALIPHSYSYQIQVTGNPQKVRRLSQNYQDRSPAPVQNRGNRVGYNSYESGFNAPGTRGFYSQSSGIYEIFLSQELAPLVEESFSPQNRDFIPGVEFALIRDNLYGRTNPNMFDSWKALNKKSLRKNRPKKLKVDRKKLLARTNRITKGKVSEEEKAQAIFSWIQDEMNWNNTYSIQAKRLDQVLTKKSGNSAEINLLLLQMLRSADLEAYPVMISTQDNGRIQTVYPDLGQFNHLIVAVKVQGVEMLLDGLSAHKDLGILPESDLTDSGFLLDQEGGRWVQLRSQNRMIRTTYSRFELNPSGQLIGQLFVTNQAYSAVVERDRLDESKTSEDYIRKHVLLGSESAEVNDLKIENSNAPGKPLQINFQVQTNDFVEVADQHMFITPMLTKKVAENPFPLANRSTPLDLTYPLRESHMLGLRLPEGYEVAQLPDPIRVVLPNNQGSFTYNVIHLDNIIHFTSAIYLNKTFFQPEEYDAVRSFFEYIVNKHEEDLIIRKIQ